MNLITDEILHEYILNPTILDKSIINEIAKRVSGSEVFKERVDNIRDFYDDYYKLSDNNNDNIDTTKKPVPSVSTRFSQSMYIKSYIRKSPHKAKKRMLIILII
jgi:hypothetical protein